jgi:hypothetical protein
MTSRLPAVLLGRRSVSFVGAQFIASFSPKLPIQLRARNAQSRRGPIPTVNLTPLYATVTKTRGAR